MVNFALCFVISFFIIWKQFDAKNLQHVGIIKKSIPKNLPKAERIQKLSAFTEMTAFCF